MNSLMLSTLVHDEEEVVRFFAEPRSDPSATIYVAKTPKLPFQLLLSGGGVMPDSVGKKLVFEK